MTAAVKHLINEYALIFTAMNAVVLDHEELEEPFDQKKLYGLTVRKMEGRVNPAHVRRCVQFVTIVDTEKVKALDKLIG